MDDTHYDAVPDEHGESDARKVDAEGEYGQIFDEDESEQVVAVQGPSRQSRRNSAGSDCTIIGSESEVDITSAVFLETSDEELNAFWKDHDIWKQNVLMTPVKVDVSEPVIGARSVFEPNPPRMFKVAWTLSRGSKDVRRRFSDFDWLRGILVRRYSGMIIPEIPEKSVVISERFLQTRMRGLNWFLSRIVASAYLRTDATVAKFFSVPDRKEWNACKAKIDRDASTSSVSGCAEPNEGYDRWRLALQAYRIPANEDTAIAKVRKDVHVLVKLLAKLLNEAKKIQVAAEQLASAMQGLCGHLQSVDGSSASNAAALEDASEPLQRILGDLGDVTTQWSTVQSCESGLLDTHLVRTLQHELMNACEMERMFSQREALSAAILRDQQSIARLEKDKVAFGRAGKADKASKTGLKLASAQVALHSAMDELDRTTKAMFFSEIDLFVDNKVDAFRIMGEKLSTASLEYLDALTDVWKNSLKRFAQRRVL